MKRHISYSLLAFSLALLVSGAVFLSTLSASESMRIFGNTTYYLFHQLFSIAIGVVIATVLMNIPLRWIKKFALPAFVVNLILLVVVSLIGVKLLGARRWIGVGGSTIQPSEFLKVTSILFLAAWLSDNFSQSRLGRKNFFRNLRNRGISNALRAYVPFLILLVMVSGLMILQKDLSTLGIITLSLMMVYFAAGTPIWHTLTTLAGETGSFFALIKLEPYRLQRFTTWLHPEADPLGQSFQLKQSLIAIGSGRIFGKGLGMSTMKFGYLPQAMGDSIFAVLGEETGLIGASAIIALFLFFFYRIIKIAMDSNDSFARLTAVGFAAWMITQTFLNMASAVGVFPLSGIPLPFFSYGGSHIIAELSAIGILLNISKNV